MTKTKTPPSLIFFGNEQLALGVKPKTPIFDALLASDYPVSALVLPSKPSRRPFAIAAKAEKHNIPVFYTKNTTEILELIKRYSPTFGVLAAYSKFIPETIINSFPKGILNIHPSLLPKYRGTTPIESTLISGDAATGVSVIQLEKAMDAGPILAQASIKLTKNTTKQSLYEELSALGAKLLIDALPSYLEDRVKLKSQDETKASFTTPLDKTSSILRPKQKSASALEREIVAFAGFPKSKITLKGIPCTITAAHAAPKAEGPLDLLCADNNYLVIDELIPENSRAMSPTAFLNGLKNR